MDRGNDRARKLTILRTLLLAAVLVGVLALTPFRPLKISGQSMQPTLKDGETYLLDHFYWQKSGIRRSDIVVVRHNEEKWVKRLIGMPGDRLQITYRDVFRSWIMRVDNLSENPSLERTGPTIAIRMVGPDEIFVIGDNLNWSADSTNQEAGAFKLENIVGVVRTFTLRRDFPFRHHL
jgi:signal peptidase I